MVQNNMNVFMPVEAVAIQSYTLFLVEKHCLRGINIGIKIFSILTIHLKSTIEIKRAASNLDITPII